jgi:hypothetical protein
MRKKSEPVYGPPIPPELVAERNAADRWWAALQRAAERSRASETSWEREERRLREEARLDARKPGEGPAY